jgi:hypothetical protein
LRNEVVSLAKVQHRILVRIIGFCLEEQEKLIVYEYLPNKSLDNLIYGTNCILLLFSLAVAELRLELRDGQFHLNLSTQIQVL